MEEEGREKDGSEEKKKKEKKKMALKILESKAERVLYYSDL